MKTKAAIKYIVAMARSEEIITDHSSMTHIATAWHAPKAARLVEAVLTLGGSVHSISTDRVRKPGSEKYDFRTCYYITFSLYFDPTERA